MTDKILVDYQFRNDRQLGGGTVEIPRTFTVAQFKNHISGKYTKEVNLDDFQVEYNNVLQPSTKKFSDFWSDQSSQEVFLISQPSLANFSYKKEDVIDVSYNFLDNAHLGVDTIEIPRSYTVAEFRKRVQSRFTHLNVKEYHVIYKNAVQPDTRKFSAFWCDDPVSEIHLEKDTLSGL